MRNQGRKSGRKCHGDACRNIMEASHIVYLIFVNIIVDYIIHAKECAKDTRMAGNATKYDRLATSGKDALGYKVLHCECYE